MAGNKDQYVAVVDIGTTNIRCHLYDKRGSIRANGLRKIQLLYPSEGHVEMSPDLLWNQFVDVVKDALIDCGCAASDIACLGITTQRNTFITFDKNTGRPFHNFITWKDNRAAGLVSSWNVSYTFKAMHAISALLYSITRQSRFMAGKVYRLVCAMVTPRLLHMIHTNKELSAGIEKDDVIYACIESFLLWKLTGGRSACTELSLASATGMFDPWKMDWGWDILKAIGMKLNILPDILDTCSEFGICDPEIFGSPIPISAMVADQQAALFGCCCFERGSVKISLSSGTFVDINTGTSPHASMKGLIPAVGWRLRDGTTSFCAEGFSYDTATAINWAQSIGLFDSVEGSSDIAESVDNTTGVYFVPAFSGIHMPVNNDTACCTFFGLKAHTEKAHMTRAVLESVAFRVYHILKAAESELDYPINTIRVCGGVSGNNFVCQMIANLIGRPLERMADSEATSLGAAFLAGLTTGFWDNVDELRDIIKIDRVFQPNINDQKQHLKEFKKWTDAVNRSLNWYGKTD